jgi:putative hydrolase of the HAD superfamily
MGRSGHRTAGSTRNSSVKRFQDIRAISLDVGGTLIDPWPSVGHVYATVAEECGLPGHDPAVITERFAAAWRSKTSFHYTSQCWADLVVKTFKGAPAEFGLDSPFFQRLYGRFAEADVWRIYDDVFPALRFLKESGYRLVAVSNWDDRLRVLLRNLRLDVFFDAIEVSAESGYHKPAPEIFRRAVEAIGARPETVLHVGDSVVEDYEGAIGAGLEALLLKRGRSAWNAHAIASLSALEARLGLAGQGNHRL